MLRDVTAFYRGWTLLASGPCVALLDIPIHGTRYPFDEIGVQACACVLFYSLSMFLVIVFFWALGGLQTDPSEKLQASKRSAPFHIGNSVGFFFQVGLRILRMYTTIYKLQYNI